MDSQTRQTPDDPPPDKRPTAVVHKGEGPDTVTPGSEGVAIDFDPRKFRVLDESDNESRRIRVIPRRAT